jgi:hypothetical protein
VDHAPGYSPSRICGKIRDDLAIAATTEPTNPKSGFSYEPGPFQSDSARNLGEGATESGAGAQAWQPDTAADNCWAGDAVCGGNLG